MVNTDEEIKWHNDGHVIHMQINKSNLEITSVDCPHKDKSEGACKHDDVNCVIEHFLNIYGLDCNVGVVAPSADLSIAWAFIGDRHKDLGACQVWVIPIEDEAFSAWIATQTTN
jgi:hypothetical protein